MRSTAPVEPSHLVKDLVLAAPHRARLLDRLHLDYFCRAWDLCSTHGEFRRDRGWATSEAPDTGQPTTFL
jgi:hypothetical protein